MALGSLSKKISERAHLLLPRVGRRLPGSVRAVLEDLLAYDPRPSPGSRGSYEALYDRLAKETPPETSIGDGDYELIGAIELGLLQQEGLRPSSTVVDFGCGTGRLAIHLVPYLASGEYMGIDISETMLGHAADNVRARCGAASARARYCKQTTPDFVLPPASVDLFCAFSVFTHMEHEDTFRYLKSIHSLLRPGGKLLLSCLPISLGVSKRIFLDEAGLEPDARWAKVRNIVTTTEFMGTLAGMAGWDFVRWYGGDEPNVTVAGRGTYALGQSTLVLRRPG